MYLILGCLFIDFIIILMSDNKIIDDFNIYEETYLTNIKEGTYEIYGVKNQKGYFRDYDFILISEFSNCRYYISNYDIYYCLYKNNIKLEILEIINEKKVGYKISDDMLIYKINKPSICNNYFICKRINSSIEEFFIETKNNEKYPHNEKYPLYTDLFGIAFYPKIHYNINNFHLNERNYITSINSSTFVTGKKYDRECGDARMNIRIKDILETYFKCENDKIYCKYNNKKEIAKLTFITDNIIETDDDTNILLQSLRLEIGNKKFTFYINNPKLIDYNKEGKYCFLVMHIRSDPCLISNNLILGYEFNKDKYYYLKYEEKLILKNIDKKIAGKYINMKNQDLYTYLLSNNERCGMTINIDKDHNVTYKLVKLNDKCFEKLIDISLLKPVSEWNKELYEINNINNINEFDSIVEGFDEEDNQK